MTSIFEGQPPKTRPKFQPKQGAPFGFQVYIPHLWFPNHHHHHHHHHQPTTSPIFGGFKAIPSGPSPPTHHLFRSPPLHVFGSGRGIHANFEGVFTFKGLCSWRHHWTSAETAKGKGWSETKRNFYAIFSSFIMFHGNFVRLICSRFSDLQQFF